MKHTILAYLIFSFMLSASQLYARDNDQEENTVDRQRFFKEMRDYKHRYLARELGLTKDQQSRFFPVYDEMEDETTKINDETRDLERRISESSDDVSDLEYDKATEALFDLKIHEGEIEKEYMNKFKDVLTKKQLFSLKSAERKFNRELMLHQMRLRKVRDQNKN